MRAHRSWSNASATYALVCAIYLALWAGLAWRAGQAGPAGLDMDRRAPQVLSAVSMIDTSAALLVMPLFVIGRAGRDAWVGAAAVAILTTMAAAVFAAQSTRLDLATVASSRVLLLATATCAGAGARLAASLCRDEYDAAGVALLATAIAVTDVVFTAPLLARLADADRLIASLLLANPLVAMAGATNFDVLRTDLLYRITPVGQRLFDYPSWHAAALTYGAGALLFLVAGTMIRFREA